MQRFQSKADLKVKAGIQETAESQQRLQVVNTVGGGGGAGGWVSGGQTPGCDHTG